MPLELIQFASFKEGLTKLKGNVFSIRDNLEARIENPVLEDGINLWNEDLLDSRTMNLCGGKNKEGKDLFKIDNNPDLESNYLTEPLAM